MALRPQPLPRKRKSNTRVVFLALLVLLAGCRGEKDGASLSFNGSVTYKGSPVEKGTIVLSDNSGKHATESAIESGRFSITADQGLAAGNYRIEVYATEATGRQMPDPDYPGQSVPETRQLLPPEYNYETKLVRELDASTTVLNFDLE